MPEIVANCPRCNSSKVTFDVCAAQITDRVYFDWQTSFELYGICRHCKSGTIHIGKALSPAIARQLDAKMIMGLGSLSNALSVNSYISLKDEGKRESPELLPENIKKAFDEGSACLAIGCYNASATMFRLCIDLATKSVLPEGEVEGLNHRTRRDLGLRLPWLFDNHLLPESMRELSTCVKDDGNDGAHKGTLLEADALDLLDFTVALLERMFTEPERIRRAQFRRDRRRAPQSN